MQEPTFLVLTALLEGPQHGYGLLSRVESASEGRVTLRVGSLYAVLERLAAELLIEVVAEAVVNSRHRRTYAMTGAGVAALRAEVERLTVLTHQAQLRLARWPVSGSAVLV